MKSTRDIGHLVAQANQHLEICRSRKVYVEQRLRSILQEYLQCEQDLKIVAECVESEEKKVKAFYAQAAPYYEYAAKIQLEIPPNVPRLPL